MVSACCGIFERAGGRVEQSALEALEATLERSLEDDDPRRWRGESVAFSCVGGDAVGARPDRAGLDRDPASGLIGVARARLDERQRLAAELSVSPVSCSDTRLILLAYRRWGADCLPRLLGDFAFVVWDPRAQGLFAARDPLGIEPFFYHLSERRFVFAPEAAAVLAHPEVSRELDEVAVREVLVHGEIPGQTHTLFRQLRRLAPGHWLRVDADRCTSGRHWSPTDVPAVELPSIEAYSEALRELLDEAVSCRLGSDPIVGAHLTGGLDSSAVAVFAGRRLREQGRELRVYSWAPPAEATPDLPEDERRMIDAVCECENLLCTHTSLPTEAAQAFRQRRLGIDPQDSLMFEHAVQQRAAAAGCRLLLSGWGGDEVISFNGRGYFSELLLAGKWATLRRELWLKSKLDHEGPLARGYGLVGLFVRRVVEPFLPDLLVDWLDPTKIARASTYFLRRDFRRRLRSAPYLPRTRMRERRGVRRNQLDLLANGHLQRRMEDWSASAARHGLVYRYPLLDKRLVEFGLGLPSRLFFDKGWKRYLFRLATEGVLPDAVRWNKSKREPAFAHARMRLRRTLQEELAEHDGVRSWKSPYVDTDRLAAVLEGRKRSPWPSARRDLLTLVRARDIARLGSGVDEPRGGA